MELRCIAIESKSKNTHNKQYYQQNRACLNEACRRYHHKYKDKINTLRQYRCEVAFIYALDVLGHKCVQCSESDPRCLQIDHINGDGYSDRHRGDVTYLWIINNPTKARERYQVLCANCNWKKRWINGEIRRDYRRKN